MLNFPQRNGWTDHGGLVRGSSFSHVRWHSRSRWPSRPPPADVSLPPAGRGDAIAAGGSHLGGAARRAHGEDRFKGVAANFSSPPFFRRSTRGSLFALVCLGIRSMGPGGGDSSGIRKERDQPDPPFPYWLILPPSSPKVTAASAEHYD